MTGRAGNREELIVGAAAGESLTELAARANLSVSTVQRRLKDEDIATAVAAERTRLRREASDRLAAIRVTALDRLAGLVNDVDPRLALRAISLVLGSSLRYDELIDLDARVAKLEAGTAPGEPAMDGGSDTSTLEPETS